MYLSAVTPSVTVIWQNCLSVEECASDLAELPVCGGVCQSFGRIACIWRNVSVIWQNCLSVDSVPVIWQNCLNMEECASDLAELPVPVIWQNCLSVEERASDLAQLPVCGGACQ
jgi:hypothetical protein